MNGNDFYIGSRYNTTFVSLVNYHHISCCYLHARRLDIQLCWWNSAFWFVL